MSDESLFEALEDLLTRVEDALAKGQGARPLNPQVQASLLESLEKLASRVTALEQGGELFNQAQTFKEKALETKLKLLQEQVRLNTEARESQKLDRGDFTFQVLVGLANLLAAALLAWYFGQAS